MKSLDEFLQTLDAIDKKFEGAHAELHTLMDEVKSSGMTLSIVPTTPAAPTPPRRTVPVPAHTRGNQRVPATLLELMDFVSENGPLTSKTANEFGEAVGIRTISTNFATHPQFFTKTPDPTDPRGVRYLYSLNASGFRALNGARATPQKRARATPRKNSK